MRLYVSARSRLGLALLGSSLASVGLFVAGALANNSTEFAYLSWNLFLAWLPLLFALWLERTVQRKLWSSWQALLLTILWVAFLPNSFYMITDYVHVQDVLRVDLLYDIIMFTSFILNGILLGYLSLHVVHHQLEQRLSKRTSSLLVAIVLAVSSFAIYVGRDLRWNTWDILANPAGILVDVSNRVLSPRAHPQIFTTTVSFFVLLGSVYVVTWYIARNLRQQKAN